MASELEAKQKPAAEVLDSLDGYWRATALPTIEGLSKKMSKEELLSAARKILAVCNDETVDGHEQVCKNVKVIGNDKLCSHGTCFDAYAPSMIRAHHRKVSICARNLICLLEGKPPLTEAAQKWCDEKYKEPTVASCIGQMKKTMKDVFAFGGVMDQMKAKTVKGNWRRSEVLDA